MFRRRYQAHPSTPRPYSLLPYTRRRPRPVLPFLHPPLEEVDEVLTSDHRTTRDTDCGERVGPRVYWGLKWVRPGSSRRPSGGDSGLIYRTGVSVRPLVPAGVSVSRDLTPERTGFPVGPE